MKVAIMQPYVFPYIGYFQLIKAVDVFVFYNDVDYIQRGWINRNRILVNNEPKIFTVPVKKSSLGTSINNVYIVNFNLWKMNFLKTLFQNYRKAKNFSFTYEILENYLLNEDFNKIDDFAESSIALISNILNTQTKFIKSSDIQIDKGLSKEKKLEYVLTKLEGKTIIMPPGSKELYQYWRPSGVYKQTLLIPNVNYNQNTEFFIENLSIIDVLMHNSIKETLQMINSYKCN